MRERQRVPDFKNYLAFLSIIGALYKGFTWVRASTDEYILSQANILFNQADKNYTDLEQKYHELQKNHERLEEIVNLIHAKQFDSHLQISNQVSDLSTNVVGIYGRLTDEIRKSKVTDLGEGVSRVSEKKV